MFNGLLAHEHYLGHRNTVGENLRYLVRDRHGRPVACALFGSAAWKCADRDAFLGWDRATRERNLQRLTNNTRFLIPGWVQVPHLASHVLGLIARRIRADWQAKYGHPIHALETFVDRSRFKGTCYRAANWLRLGETRGRTRNDRAHRIRAAIKDVYLYPLVPTCDGSCAHDDRARGGSGLPTPARKPSCACSCELSRKVDQLTTDFAALKAENAALRAECQALRERGADAQGAGGQGLA